MRRNSRASFPAVNSQLRDHPSQPRGRGLINRDIWAAANVLLVKYGREAEIKAAERIDALSAAGDEDGVAVWQSILRVIGQLRGTAPTGAIH